MLKQAFPSHHNRKTFNNHPPDQGHQNRIDDEQGLVAVVERGTGNSARLDSIKVAGKTGTAQKWEDGSYSSNYITSFVGFLPTDSPQILVTCIVDNPQTEHTAGAVCAPMFKDIADGILKLKQYREIVSACVL